MTGDEERIRELIERWAEAVHAGDLDRVLADHADDIVMYDVPPPYEGVHGIEAYKETWPGFFQWQAQGASFEIETLDVTAGSDVAFAHALLRCGTPGELAANPGYRLRLTLGLRKEDGRWVVAHEHHSFPLGDEGAAEEEVRQVHERWYAETAAKDLDGMMTAIADDVVSYEHETPLEYVGVDEVRKVCARGLDVPGDVSFDVPDLKILVREDLAVAWGLNRVRVAGEDGQVSETWSRGTRVFERRDGAWMMTHQHLSFPLDQATGAARTDLRPSPPR
ncbi:SgcJ/EcaC family oxidoreductase [Nonomuraea sp. 10N515B]|uniref:SgcJ/EcaC family oxidoreductase n=1 Tax=Nonomuraea sp. 10N515B TaxID=3457422 RepID=UPI003FCD92C3